MPVLIFFSVQMSVKHVSPDNKRPECAAAALPVAACTAQHVTWPPRSCVQATADFTEGSDGDSEQFNVQQRVKNSQRKS